MGAVSWLTRLVEVFDSFRSSTTAGTGEASAFNSPTTLKALNEKELETMSASELKQYASALRQVADGLEKLARKKETLPYPKFCSDLHNYMKTKKGRIYLEDIMSDLGKTKNTVRTEISHLRKAGIHVDKQYVSSAKKYEYFLAVAA